MIRFSSYLLVFMMLRLAEAHAQIEDSTHFEDSFLPNQENWEENESDNWVISINAQDLGPLLILPGVEPKHLQAIQAYIKNYGQILHVHELHQIPNLSETCIATITPHISVKAIALNGEKKSFVNFRIKKGTTTPAILRSQVFLQAHANISMGGQWSHVNNQINSNYTAYADYRKNNLHIIAGDFSPLIGAGKVGSAPSMNNMGWGFTQVIRPLFRIKPYTSTIPMQQWRGLGYTQQTKNWTWILAIPLAQGNQQKIVAIQYKDKTKSWGTGVLQDSTFKHWFQAVIPWGQHVFSIENVYDRRDWQPSFSGNFVLSKTVKSKWQSEWQVQQWNECTFTHWIIMLEWNFGKGQYLTLGREFERNQKDREVGTLGSSNKLFLQYQYEPQRYGKFYIRYLHQYLESPGDETYPYSLNRQLRGDGQWKADENWSLHTRAELHWTNEQKSTLAFQDLQWHPMGKSWKITMRYAIMNCSAWEGRIYAMEKETSGSFYIPAYHGNGNRYYVVCEYKKSHFQLQIKLGKWEKRQENEIPMDGQVLLKIIF